MSREPRLGNVVIGHKEMDIAIISPTDGIKVGHIRLTIYLGTDHESLKRRFGPFLRRIPFEWDCPLGVFEDLHVNEDHRRKGYGRLGLSMADQEFRKSGVRVGLLKVGWSVTEDWEKANSWKTEWYVKAGWVPIPWTLPEPVLMVKEYAVEPSR